MNKNKKGFTLIELLIVIAIIGLLATLAIVSLTTAQRKARDTKRVADVKSIQSALELYYSDNAAYPTPADWADLGTNLGTYLTQLPSAPNHANGEFYSVVLNDNAGDDATEYVVGATLEDASHQALSQDDDSTYNVAGWANIVEVQSAGVADNVLACTDPLYCLGE